MSLVDDYIKTYELMKVILSFEEYNDYNIIIAVMTIQKLISLYKELKNHSVMNKYNFSVIQELIKNKEDLKPIWESFDI